MSDITAKDIAKKYNVNPSFSVGFDRKGKMQLNHDKADEGNEERTWLLNVPFFAEMKMTGNDSNKNVVFEATALLGEEGFTYYMTPPTFGEMLLITTIIQAISRGWWAFKRTGTSNSLVFLEDAY